MPDRQHLLQARDLRARVEEVLARAETFRNADCRQGVRKIAETVREIGGAARTARPQC
jgi:hypothetical protein